MEPGRSKRCFADRNDRVCISGGAHQCGALIRKRLRYEAFRFATNTRKDEMGATGTRVQFCVEPSVQSRQFGSAMAREARESRPHKFLKTRESSSRIAR
jgi:hypothetical protein